MFSKNGGNMAEAGSVSWMFHKKGYIVIEKSKADEETLMTLAIDAGADDFNSEQSGYEITTPLESLKPLRLNSPKIENSAAIWSSLLTPR